jgi:Uma2 family endonuclease
MATRVVLTYQEYEALPNDGRRLGLVSQRGVEGAPTLAIEVLSPSTTLTDRSTKLQLYARHAVPYCWIVDPEARRIEVYRLADTAYVLETTASGTAPVTLPPLALAVVPASLWA